jgi:hypothetical protein
MSFATHACVDLPFELAAKIEVYVDDALRSTGTKKASTFRVELESEPEPEPEPVPDPDLDIRTYRVDDSPSLLDYAALFDEPLPDPLPRRRAPRGSQPPQQRTDTAPETFDDVVTAVMSRPVAR